MGQKDTQLKIAFGFKLVEDVIFRLAPFVHLLFSVALRITFPNKIADFRDRLIFFFALNIFLSDHEIKFVRSKNTDMCIT